MMKKRRIGQGHAKKRGDTWTAVWTVGFEALEGGKLRQVYKKLKEAFAQRRKLFNMPLTPMETVMVKRQTCTITGRPGLKMGYPN